MHDIKTSRIFNRQLCFPSQTMCVPFSVIFISMSSLTSLILVKTPSASLVCVIFTSLIPSCLSFLRNKSMSIGPIDPYSYVICFLKKLLTSCFGIPSTTSSHFLMLCTLSLTSRRPESGANFTPVWTSCGTMLSATSGSMKTWLFFRFNGNFMHSPHLKVIICLAWEIENLIKIKEF